MEKIALIIAFICVILFYACNLRWFKNKNKLFIKNVLRKEKDYLCLVLKLKDEYIYWKSSIRS
jgi:hypothetical protein